MKLLGGKKPVFSITKGIELKQIVLEMLKHNTLGVENEFALQGLLCKFFSIVSSEVTHRGKKAEDDSKQNYYIRKAIEFIRDNYSNGVNVSDISEYVGLNRSYFSKLFRDSMGCPPQEFLIRLRLSKAADQLKGTENTIGAIATQCGYPNQLHFTRAFHKRYGLSPREWRKENQVKRER